MHLRSIHFRSDRSPSPGPPRPIRNRTLKSLPKREPVCPCPVCSSSKIENSPPNDIDFGSTVRTDRPTVPMGCITLGHYCNCCTPGLPCRARSFCSCGNISYINLIDSDNNRRPTIPFGKWGEKSISSTAASDRWGRLVLDAARKRGKNYRPPNPSGGAVTLSNHRRADERLAATLPSERRSSWGPQRPSIRRNGAVNLFTRF